MVCSWLVRLRRALFALLLALAHVSRPATVSAAQTQKQVLVIYEHRNDAQIVMIGDRDLPQLISKGINQPVAYYSEFLDDYRSRDSSYQLAFRDLLRLKYREDRFD